MSNETEIPGIKKTTNNYQKSFRFWCVLAILSICYDIVFYHRWNALTVPALIGSIAIIGCYFARSKYIWHVLMLCWGLSKPADFALKMYGERHWGSLRGEAFWGAMWIIILYQIFTSRGASMQPPDSETDKHWRDILRQ